VKRTARMVLTAAVWIPGASSALAHHSHPRFYDSCLQVTIAGQIESVEWKNPHIRVVVEMGDGTSYTAELPAPERFARNGIAEAAMAALTVGARITVEGNPLRDPAEIRASFPEIPAITNTRVLDVYSISRQDNSWSWSLTPTLRGCQ
jgi:hypothetical protein